MSTKYLTCKTWNNQNEKIVTHVGVDGIVYPKSDVIGWIENNTHRIAVKVGGGNEVTVRVGISSRGNKFLTTNPDGTPCNNIDNLTSC